MKRKYEKIAGFLQEYSEEEHQEKLYDAQIIEKLAKENEYLRKLLKINCNHGEILEKFEKKSEFSAKNKQNLHKNTLFYEKHRQFTQENNGFFENFLYF